MLNATTLALRCKTTAPTSSESKFTPKYTDFKPEEAATTSALYEANSILNKEGLKEEPICSIPLKGVIAR